MEGEGGRCETKGRGLSVPGLCQKQAALVNRFTVTSLPSWSALKQVQLTHQTKKKQRTYTPYTIDMFTKNILTRGMVGIIFLVIGVYSTLVLFNFFGTTRDRWLLRTK